MEGRAKRKYLFHIERERERERKKERKREREREKERERESQRHVSLLTCRRGNKKKRQRVSGSIGRGDLKFLLSY